MQYNYRRRVSRPVRVGRTVIGGDSPVRLQSMANTSTNDVAASAAQVARIVAKGGELVRLTTQGRREAQSLGRVREMLSACGLDVPLAADVHFNPDVALEAARYAHKVRINPGNFADTTHSDTLPELDDKAYAARLAHVEKCLLPLVDECRERAVALRIGVNHGSLSDRIMARYGDTPEGMSESVMEYLRILHRLDFHDIVVSVKASNASVMIETVRLLAARMDAEGMNYPLHLGVTEAGDGLEGRVKSAVGIGTLLAEGLGDTIRVSLSEAPENEIPVAGILRDYISTRAGHAPVVEPERRPEGPEREMALPIMEGWKVSVPAVVGVDIRQPDPSWLYADASDDPALITGDSPLELSSRHVNPVGEMASYIDRLRLLGKRNPVILRMRYAVSDPELVSLMAAADLGALLSGGYGSAVWLESEGKNKPLLRRVAMAILQATRLRMTQTEYIACPSCGRTLFDLPATLAAVREATGHLKGLKIGVMGCIVNGPGEMADADYGYVGAGPGRVSLYKGRKLVRKNIPTSEALDALVSLIKEGGDWKPRPSVSARKKSNFEADL